ncbi:dimethylarginine dimethylaminohydrolase family protein [Labedella endophytica]|uniref:Amidinotransferase n=1 Tax=Labedella endophytica TaxID=1523160 RepID=A0A433JUB2_9MICO|nr:arginine deiminase family protein [Labedella endophytica]RUR01756.1 amidinotransferase [Labedella endophytica]
MSIMDSTKEIADGRFHRLMGPEALPAFHDLGELEGSWGRRWGAADEVGRLRSVLMRRPSAGLAAVRTDAYDADMGAFVDPDLRWYWTGEDLPDLDLVHAQYDGFVGALEREGVEVVFAPDLPPSFTKSVYTRDPLVTVPGGAVIGRLAPRMRRGEEQSIAATVARAGMPILGTVTGAGLAEGGSFMKVRRDLAFYGSSVRCNPEGGRQLGRILEPYGIRVQQVSLPGYLIHLDMCAVMLDDDLALVNPRLAPYDFMTALWDLGIETVDVHPDEEWSTNLLVLNRRRVLLPAHLERTAEMLSSRHGVEVVPIEFREMLKNGGGLHCSTMELQRDWS